MIKIVNGILAILGGVGGALIVFWVFNFLVERLPGRWEDRVKPYVFVGPALGLIGLFLIYPTVQTIFLSFANANSTRLVGLRNYTQLFGSKDFRQVLVNNVLWIAIVPAISVLIGLLVAVLADRLRPRGESIVKSAIFLPMAISFVGASTIWRFVYDYRPQGQAQIGLLNAILTSLGFAPQSWLQISSGKVNSLLLMVIMVWLQAGFAMVLLSSAIKGVPVDTLEAGRIDGAGEVAIFFRIVVPQIWATVLTVFITILIGVMKVFDVVYVMTGGNFDTDVIGHRFYTEIFQNDNQGRGAAIVVILMIAVLPVLIYQVRQFRAQEAR